VAECTLGPDCLDRRSVILRAGAPAIGQTLGALQLDARFGIHAHSVRRRATTVEEPPADYLLEAGDELLLAGDARAFAQAAPLFRSGSLSEAEAAALEAAAERRKVDTSQTLELHPRDGAACGHLDRIRPQRPRTPGCEECLAAGERWVHLRLCMSCGHVGCCDSSPNKHATKHWQGTEHPIMRSLEPGEDWGWCFPDTLEL
jgi:CPA2 family monovalent cation:H+ antiporter-2